jgi:hypothetical protein
MKHTAFRGEKKKGGRLCSMSQKIQLSIFVDYIYKMWSLRGSGTPVLYTRGTVAKG